MIGVGIAIIVGAAVFLAGFLVGLFIASVKDFYE